MGRGRLKFHEAQGWCGQPQWKCKDWTFLLDCGRGDESKDSREVLEKGGWGVQVRGWGSQRMKIAPGHDKKKKKGLIIGILIPLFLSVPTFLYCLRPVISSFFFIPHRLCFSFISSTISQETPTLLFFNFHQFAATSSWMWWVQERKLWPQAGGGIRAQGQMSAW